MTELIVNLTSFPVSPAASALNATTISSSSIVTPVTISNIVGISDGVSNKSGVLLTSDDIIVNNNSRSGGVGISDGSKNNKVMSALLLPPRPPGATNVIADKIDPEDSIRDIVTENDLYRFVLFKRHYDKYVALAARYEEARGLAYYLEERYHEVK
ncbi:hypothetical protein QAD02_006379, partial [Eretmocerus hayati]